MYNDVQCQVNYCSKNVKLLENLSEEENLGNSED